jgi:hypothetical protein
MTLAPLTSLGLFIAFQSTRDRANVVMQSTEADRQRAKWRDLLLGSDDAFRFDDSNAGSPSLPLLNSSVCRWRFFMRRLFLSLLVFAFTLPSLAQAKHPFTFEDMMKLKRVGDPQVSPDGKWVIFSVVDVDLEANTKTPHIWVEPLAPAQESGSEAKSGVPHVSPNLRDAVSKDEGTTERILIPDQDGERPRWSPDGKRFAFLSTKEGGSQVWIAEFDGHEGVVSRVFRWTQIATEATGELWSPDGKNILYVSDVYPECFGIPEAEGACLAKKVEEA